MVSSGILRRVALERTEVSEELSTSFIRMTRIDELGTTLALTSNRRTSNLTLFNFSIFTFREDVLGRGRIDAGVFTSVPFGGE
jgi:hypothetical protein